MTRRLGGAPLWTGLWLILLAATLTTRPLLPIDETRYLSVAWEMWIEGEILVPQLNGQAYSHKPPLLFWLIQLGWWAFGVDHWWPRLVAPLFGLACLFTTAALARRLWPGGSDIASLAPLILLGSLLWTIFTTLTMFDTLVAFFTLLGLLGIVMAWRGSPARGWALLGLAIGLGVLAKGPVILVYALPPALLAPWWARDPRPVSWPAWYGGLAAALLLGTAIALAWAIPAAAAGGAAYGESILWGQTTGRLVGSFAHGRPLWWYVPLLPLLLYPWLLWPPLWRSAFRRSAFRQRRPADTGLRFCLAWILPAFALLSLFSGKQVHYFLPILPGIALALASLTALKPETGESRTGESRTGESGTGESGTGRGWDRLPVALVCVLLGITFLAGLPLAEMVPRLARNLPPWSHDIGPGLGLSLLACGVVVGAMTRRRLATPWSPRTSATTLALLSVTMVVLGHLLGMKAPAGAYDLEPLAARLADFERSGRAVAHLGQYHGQYQFLGRLERPLQVISKAQVRAWFADYPEGRLVAYHRLPLDWEKQGPLYRQGYREKAVAIWDRQAVLANPGLFP